MLAFTDGARNLPPLRLDQPPAEIASLADTYATMTATILRDEADLEDLVHEKEGLLREVHHRTGNSLQLIASILRMHLRENPSDEVRAVLGGRAIRLEPDCQQGSQGRDVGRHDVSANSRYAATTRKLNSGSHQAFLQTVPAGRANNSDTCDARAARTEV